MAVLLSQVEAFIEVARTRNVSRAADYSETTRQKNALR